MMIKPEPSPAKMGYCPGHGQGAISRRRVGHRPVECRGGAPDRRCMTMQHPGRLLRTNAMNGSVRQGLGRGRVAAPDRHRVVGEAPLVDVHDVVCKQTFEVGGLGRRDPEAPAIAAAIAQVAECQAVVAGSVPAHDAELLGAAEHRREHGGSRCGLWMRMCQGVAELDDGFGQGGLPGLGTLRARIAGCGPAGASWFYRLAPHGSHRGPPIRQGGPWARPCTVGPTSLGPTSIRA